MDRIAFVFSGQGDQFPGMGKELASSYEAAEKVFKMCDQLRPGTSHQCFFGTDEELKETKNTQACLFAMEMAAAAVLSDKGIKPEAAAGFSLGEVTAAAFAGLFDRETGFRLVCARGEAMQAAAEKCDTAMAAVLKLDEERVSELCREYDGIYPVNFNCPGQITVAGLAEKMPGFSKAVKNAGGRALPLKVKGAFHSPFMESASAAFGETLKTVEFGEPEMRLYSNVTAAPYGKGDAAKKLLEDQIKSPVRWEALIKNMIADGIDTFIEIGPGATLTNMIKKIDKNVKAYDTAQALEQMEEK